MKDWTALAALNLCVLNLFGVSGCAEQGADTLPWDMPEVVSDGVPDDALEPPVPDDPIGDMVHDSLTVEEVPLEPSDAPADSVSSPSQGAQHQNANLYAYWTAWHRGLYNADQLILVKNKAPQHYWASNWTWVGSSSGGYTGLQTDGTRFDGSRGDTAIFSLWNSNGASGPNCGTFGGEGTGHSCRLAYPIRTDRYYRLRVWRLNADRYGQWWGAWIKDMATGQERSIGAIRVAHRYTLMNTPTNFSEYFGRAVGCDNVSQSVVYWTPVSGNGQTVPSVFSGGHRGSCVGGSVAHVGMWWTMGARIIQGGRR